jgi:actin-related protein
MQVAEIELYEILKSKLGEKEAKSVIEYVEAKVEKKFDEKKDILVTKTDLANLKTELMVEIEKVRTDMNKIKADIIKWMFIFWVGQIGALIAILQIFFRN